MSYFSHSFLSNALHCLSHSCSAPCSHVEGVPGFGRGAAAGRTGAVHQERPVHLRKVGLEKYNKRQDSENLYESLVATLPQQ